MRAVIRYICDFCGREHVSEQMAELCEGLCENERGPISPAVRRMEQILGAKFLLKNREQTAR